jgi:hypothetical protein
MASETTIEEAAAGTPIGDTEYLFDEMEAEHGITRSPLYKIFASNVFSNEGHKLLRSGDVRPGTVATDYLVTQNGINGQEVVGIDPKINRSFYENLGINPSDKDSLVPFSSAENLIYGKYWDGGSDDRLSLKQMDDDGGIIPQIILALADMRYFRGARGDGLLLKTMHDYDHVVKKQKNFPYMSDKELNESLGRDFPVGSIGPKAALSLSNRSKKEQLEIFELYRGRQAEYGRHLDKASEHGDHGFENRYLKDLYTLLQMENLDIRREMYRNVQFLKSAVPVEQDGVPWSKGPQ